MDMVMHTVIMAVGMADFILRTTARTINGYGPYFYGYPYSGGFGFYFAPQHHH